VVYRGDIVAVLQNTSAVALAADQSWIVNATPSSVSSVV
jgi:hypothetical protein